MAVQGGSIPPSPIRETIMKMNIQKQAELRSAAKKLEKKLRKEKEESKADKLVLSLKKQTASRTVRTF